MKEKVDLLLEHYQKTYELTFELWKQRNQTFLVLLVVIGAATLLTFREAETNSLLVLWIAKALGVTGKDVQDIEKGLPLGILQSLVVS